MHFHHRVLLTGTPLQNNLDELFHLLSFIRPDQFDSLSEFQEQFSSLDSTRKVRSVCTPTA